MGLQAAGGRIQSRFFKTIEGEVEERKGIATLLEAAAILKSDIDGFKLILTGLVQDSPEGKSKAHIELEREASRLGILDNLILQRFSHEDMSAVYAAADVMCLPSWDEPCSMVIIEAMAAGLPVVAVRAPGSVDVLTEGGGVLTENKPELFARDVVDILTVPGRQKELSKDALRAVFA